MRIVTQNIVPRDPDDHSFSLYRGLYDWQLKSTPDKIRKYYYEKISAKRITNKEKHAFHEIPSPLWDTEETSLSLRQTLVFPSDSAWIYTEKKRKSVVDNVINCTKLNYVNMEGPVKLVSWCPNVSSSDQILAVLVSKTDVSHELNLHPKNNTELIHILDCGIKFQRTVDHKLLFSFEHNWGSITAMQWISPDISLNLAKYNSSPTVKSHTEMQPLYGHMLFCCTDGFMRICPIPTSSLPINKDNNIMSFNPKNVLKLGLGHDYLNDMRPFFGYPTCAHWISQFPGFIVSGYSSGHIGIFDLTCVDLFNYDFVHHYLISVHKRRLSYYPVTSIAMSPTNWQAFNYTVDSNDSSQCNFVYKFTERTLPVVIIESDSVVMSCIWPSRADVLVSTPVTNDYVNITSILSRKTVSVAIPGIRTVASFDKDNSIVVTTESGTLSIISLNDESIVRQLMTNDNCSDSIVDPLNIRHYRIHTTKDPNGKHIKTLVDCSTQEETIRLYKSVSFVDYPQINTIDINPNIGYAGWSAIGFDCGAIHFLKLSEDDPITLPTFKKKLFSEIKLPNESEFLDKRSLSKSSKNNVRLTPKSPMKNPKKEKTVNVKGKKPKTLEIDPLDWLLSQEDSVSSPKLTKSRNMKSSTKKKRETNSQTGRHRVPIYDKSDLFSILSDTGSDATEPAICAEEDWAIIDNDKEETIVKLETEESIIVEEIKSIVNKNEENIDAIEEMNKEIGEVVKQETEEDQALSAEENKIQIIIDASDFCVDYPEECHGKEMSVEVETDLNKTNDNDADIIEAQQSDNILNKEESMASTSQFDGVNGNLEIELMEECDSEATDMANEHLEIMPHNFVTEDQLSDRFEEGKVTGQSNSVPVEETLVTAQSNVIIQESQETVLVSDIIEEELKDLTEDISGDMELETKTEEEITIDKSANSSNSEDNTENKCMGAEEIPKLENIEPTYIENNDNVVQELTGDNIVDTDNSELNCVEEYSEINGDISSIDYVGNKIEKESIVADNIAEELTESTIVVGINEAYSESDKSIDNETLGDKETGAIELENTIAREESDHSLKEPEYAEIEQSPTTCCIDDEYTFTSEASGTVKIEYGESVLLPIQVIANENCSLTDGNIDATETIRTAQDIELEELEAERIKSEKSPTIEEKSLDMEEGKIIDNIEENIRSSYTESGNNDDQHTVIDDESAGMGESLSQCDSKEECLMTEANSAVTFEQECINTEENDECTKEEPLLVKISAEEDINSDSLPVVLNDSDVDNTETISIAIEECIKEEPLLVESSAEEHINLDTLPSEESVDMDKLTVIPKIEERDIENEKLIDEQLQLSVVVDSKDEDVNTENTSVLAPPESEEFDIQTFSNNIDITVECAKEETPLTEESRKIKTNNEDENMEALELEVSNIRLKDDAEMKKEHIEETANVLQPVRRGPKKRLLNVKAKGTKRKLENAKIEPKENITENENNAPFALPVDPNAIIVSESQQSSIELVKESDSECSELPAKRTRILSRSTVEKQLLSSFVDKRRKVSTSSTSNDSREPGKNSKIPEIDQNNVLLERRKTLRQTKATAIHELSAKTSQMETVATISPKLANLTETSLDHDRRKSLRQPVSDKQEILEPIGNKKITETINVVEEHRAMNRRKTLRSCEELVPSQETVIRTMEVDIGEEIVAAKPRRQLRHSSGTNISEIIVDNVSPNLRRPLRSSEPSTKITENRDDQGKDSIEGGRRKLSRSSPANSSKTVEEVIESRESEIYSHVKLEETCCRRSSRNRASNSSEISAQNPDIVIVSDRKKSLRHSSDFDGPINKEVDDKLTAVDDKLRVVDDKLTVVTEQETNESELEDTTSDQNRRRSLRGGHLAPVVIDTGKRRRISSMDMLKQNCIANVDSCHVLLHEAPDRLERSDEEQLESGDRSIGTEEIVIRQEKILGSIRRNLKAEHIEEVNSVRSPLQIDTGEPHSLRRRGRPRKSVAKITDEPLQHTESENCQSSAEIVCPKNINDGNTVKKEMIVDDDRKSRRKSSLAAVGNIRRSSKRGICEIELVSGGGSGAGSSGGIVPGTASEDDATLVKLESANLDDLDSEPRIKKRRLSQLSGNDSAVDSSKDESSVKSTKSKRRESWHSLKVLIEWRVGRFYGVQQTINGRLFELAPVNGQLTEVNWPKPTSKKFPIKVIEIL